MKIKNVEMYWKKTMLCVHFSNNESWIGRRQASKGKEKSSVGARI